MIAVGEIKSRLDKSELEDAFDKTASLKQRRRHAVPRPTLIDGITAVDYRNYGSVMAFGAVPNNQFDQDSNHLDQIFAFVLCGEFASSPETTLQNARDLWQQKPAHERPNLIVSLKDGFIVPWNGSAFLHSTMNATGLVFCNEFENGFSYLLGQLNYYVRHGRTVELGHLQRYLGTATASFRVTKSVGFETTAI